MLIYIILAVIYLFIAFIDSKTKKNPANKYKKIIKIFIFLFPLFIMVAFRNINVGNDTKMYEHLYNTYSKLSYKEALKITSKEIGFITFCYLLGKNGFNYIFFQFLIALVTYYLFGRYLYKHSNNIPMSIFIFMCILGFFRSMNIQREMIAVMFALNAFDNYIEGEKIKFVVEIIFASLFHRTILVMLIFILYDVIKSLKSAKKFIIFTTGIIIVLFYKKIFLFVTVLTGHYSYLENSKYFTSNGGIAMFISIILCLFSYYFENKHKKELLNVEEKDKMIEKYIYRSKMIELAYFINFIMSIVGLKFGLADRIVIVFSVFFCESGSYNNIKSKNYFYIKIAYILCLFIYYILVMIYRNNWHTTIPYSFYNF